MTKKILIVISILVLVGVVSLYASKGKGAGNGNGICIFVDENGDGINDNFRDSDGDGIPNYLDADWVRPQDGSGYGTGNGKMMRNRTGNMSGTLGGFSSLGNQFKYGNGNGTGVCDGSGVGSSGNRRRGGRG